MRFFGAGARSTANTSAPAPEPAAARAYHPSGATTFLARPAAVHRRCVACGAHSAGAEIVDLYWTADGLRCATCAGEDA